MTLTANIPNALKDISVIRTSTQINTLSDFSI